MHLTGRVARLAYELLLTRVLGSVAFGTFALAISVFEVARAVAYAGLDHAAVRYIAAFQAKGHPSRIRDTIVVASTLALGTGSVTAIALALLAPSLSTSLFSLPELALGIRVVAVALVPNVLLVMSAAALRARGHFASERALLAVVQPLTLASVTALAVWVFGGLKSAFYAFAISYGVIGMVAVVAFARGYRDVLQVGRRLEWRGAAPVVRFALPMLAITVAYILLAEVGRLMLGYLAGPHAVGIYTAAARVSIQLAILYQGLDALVGPTVAALHAGRQHANLEASVRSLTLWAVLLAAPLLVLIGIDPAFVMSAFGPDFRAGASVLVVLSAAQFILIAVGPTGRVLQMTDRARVDALITGMAVIAATALNLLLIPRLGALGAALGSASGMVLLNLVQLLLVRKLVAVNPVGKETLGTIGAAVGALLLGWVLRALAPIGFAGWLVASTSALAVFGILAARILGLRSTRDLVERLHAMLRTIRPTPAA